MSYELKSARYLAREVIGQAVLPGDAAVDATMGNGHDTLMLCEAVGPAGKVYAFDVQEQALAETEKRLKEHGMDGRAVLIHAGHEHMAEYVKEPVRAVMFNLGWLPGGDHDVTTRWETTRQAVESALSLLLGCQMIPGDQFNGLPPQNTLPISRSAAKQHLRETGIIPDGGEQTAAAAFK